MSKYKKPSKKDEKKRQKAIGSVWDERR